MRKRESGLARSSYNVERSTNLWEPPDPGIQSTCQAPVNIASGKEGED